MVDELHPKHVFVTPDFELQLHNAVRKLPSKLRVVPKVTCTLPLPCISSEHVASATGEENVLPPEDEANTGEFGFVVTVQRTFIHVNVPTSLCSSTSRKNRASSSTDANPRTCV